MSFKSYPPTNGTVVSVVAGTGISVNDSDAVNPIVSATGVASVVAGSGISVDAADPANPVVSVSGVRVATTRVQTNTGTKQALISVVPTGKLRVILMVVLRNASTSLATMNDSIVFGGVAEDDFGYLDPGASNLLTAAAKVLSFTKASFYNDASAQLSTQYASGTVFGVTFYDTSISGTLDIDVHYYDADA